MIYVLKEYEIKTKMVQEQWLLLKRMFLFFIRLNWLSVEGNKNLVGRGWMSKFFCWWGDSLILPVGKTLYKPCQQVFIYNKEALCTSHTSCAKVAILLLQDLSTLCVTDIHGVYFHFSVQCLYCNKFITPWTHLIRSNDGEYLSLDIKHTCSWRNKSVVYIYIYIYIRSKPSKNHKMSIFYTHCFQKY